MGVVESAARLFEQLSAVGDEFTRYLRPGLSTERMDDLLGRAGLPQPPSDVREFYGAFDLVPGYQYELDQPSFYGQHVPLLPGRHVSPHRLPTWAGV
ncbi:hypothetical protein H7H51_21820 [Mycolicibacterium farcinogenes]|nr:hypothetical protein [Mycolicibacterium farcinogenes]